MSKQTLRCSCVVSTGRPSLSQVMLGGGMPLEIHSRLMGLWRTTARSAGPLVRIDGGTAKVQKIDFLVLHIYILQKYIIIYYYFLRNTLQKKIKSQKIKLQKGREQYLPTVGTSLWLAFREYKFHVLQLEHMKTTEILICSKRTIA